MDIGIGLPSTIPGIPGRLIVEWAVAVERVGFWTLGTIDRVVYGNLERLSVMAAAAAVTERIGLTTAAPNRAVPWQASAQKSALEELPGHDHALDLVGALVDLSDRGPAGSSRR